MPTPSTRPVNGASQAAPDEGPPPQRLAELTAIGALARNVAHELNNLLTALIGNLSLARGAAGDNERVLAKLQAAEHAVERAQALASRLALLAIDKPLHRTPQAIGPLVREALTLATQGSHVSVAYELDPDLGRADLDGDLISQALQQLARNAVEAMPGGGVLRVVSRGGAVGTPPQPALLLELHDQGPGLADEIRARLFEPYASTKGKGRGLGLAIAHAIAARHGGRLTLRAEGGRGTIATLELPLLQASAPGASAPELRVLLVESDELLAAVAVHSLRLAGCRVERFADCASATAQLSPATGPYHVLALDLSAPGPLARALDLVAALPDARLVISRPATSAPVAIARPHAGLTRPLQLDELLAAILGGAATAAELR